VTTWRDRSEQPVVSYGWLEDKRLMVTLATPFRRFAQPQGKKPSEIVPHLRRWRNVYRVATWVIYISI